ncbi:MAG: 2-amino-4-hydroxy-6-hydroxymethyldihydropteridine diphosphokinase [Phycisphaerales bacterium]
MTPRVVHVALGSNLPSPAGDRLATLAAALEALEATADVRVGMVSSAWETEPIGPAQPRYLNAAAELVTSRPIREVLQAALEVERRLGRDRTREARWGPRTLDVDIVLAGESSIDEPGLVVPHPRLLERAFVLAPLCEIAADARVPPLLSTVRSHWLALADSLRRSPRDEPGDGLVARIGPIPFRANRSMPAR